jgi:GNAT superfamily N-acetyltransferase
VPIDVRPAGVASLADVEAVFAGPRGRDACWCQRFRGASAVDNQSALASEIESAAEPIGLIAYRDDEPAGWSRVVPRHTLPGVVGNRALQRIFADDPYQGAAAWWISCFAVRRTHRGHGVGVELLRAAVAFARERGAQVLDGHPVDARRLKGTPSPSALFTGTTAMFTAAGFEELGRTYASRPVMRKAL